MVFSQGLLDRSFLLLAYRVLSFHAIQKLSEFSGYGMAALFERYDGAERCAHRRGCVARP
jgi:hypothetical protein